MAVLLGARALGIQVQWSFGFVGQGSNAQTTPGVVYLDVGNRLCPGVLDQHQSGDLGGCTSELLMSHPELVYHHLLGDLLACHARGELSPGRSVSFRIITHHAPDWDGCVSSFLVQRLVEEGELPAYSEALVGYAKEVDQGRFSLKKYLDNGELGVEALSLIPHLAALVIAHLARERGWSDDDVLRRGHAVLQATLEGLLASAGSPRTWSWETFETLEVDAAGTAHLRPAAGAWSHLPDCRDIPAAIVADRHQWCAESEDAERLDVALPVDEFDGDPFPKVPAIFLRRPSKSMLNKYWSRAEGRPLLVCPYDDASSGPLLRGAVVPRVIISLPDALGWWPTGIRPAHLRGLGALLEREETRVRVERGQRRLGHPRWDDDAYCDNADPWYDGRGHAFGILDTPRCGTILPYDDILDHIRNVERWADQDVPVDDLLLDVWMVDVQAVAVDPRPLGQGSSHGSWSHLSSTLESWKRDQATSSLLRHVEVTAPAGLEVEELIAHQVKRGPSPTPVSDPDIYPVVVRVRARSSPDKKGTLGLVAVLKWLIELRSKLTSPAGDLASSERLERSFLVMTWTAARSQPSSPASVKHAMARLGVSVAHGQGTLVGSRAVVTQVPSGAWGKRDAELHAGFAEMMGYMAFLDGTLSRVSRQIARSVAPPARTLLGSRASVGGLRSSFLVFQGLYFQPEVSTIPELQSGYDVVGGLLKLEAHYREVESELDRLEQVESERARMWTNRSLELLSLMGIVQVVDVIAQGWIERLNSEQHGYRFAIVALFAVGAVVVFLALVRKQRRD